MLEKAIQRKLLFSPILFKGKAMRGKAAKVIVTEKQHAILSKFAKAKASAVSLTQLRRIILLALEGHNNEAIEKYVGVQHDAVGTWRRRWRDGLQRLIDIEGSEKPHALEQEIQKQLSDRQRSGRKPSISPEQQAVSFRKYVKT